MSTTTTDSSGSSNALEALAAKLPSQADLDKISENVQKISQNVQKIFTDMLKKSDKIKEDKEKDIDRREIVPEEDPFKDYVNAEQFALEIYNLINQEDIENTLEVQYDIMTKIQQVNDTLSTANDFSLKAYTSINKDFEKHTRIMKELKKDLDFIFKKIRTLQTKLAQRFPEEYAEIDEE